MAVRSIHRNYLAFFNEVTPCLAPADWVANGTAIEHLSADVSGVKQLHLKDPTLEGRVMSVGKRLKIKGLRNCEMSVGLKLHGTGAATAAEAQVAQTYLGTLLKHTMGGSVRGYTNTLTGGSTVVPEIDDATGIVPGMLLAFEDTTAPTAENTGKLHFRRVLSLDTLEITLSEALPFTPAAGDLVHGTITSHIDEEYLEDAVAAGGLMQWFVQKTKAGTGGTDLLWQVEGSVASMAIGGLSRGELPSLTLSVMAANFKHGGADSLTNKTFTSLQGSAQLSMGIDVQCSIGAYGNTAVVEQEVNAVQFDPGYTRVRVETTTELTDRFEGTATYSLVPGDTRFTVTIVNYDDSWYQSLKVGDEFRINFYQPGDGSGPGKAWGLHIARAQLVETPGRADINEVHGATLVFEAMEPDDTTGGSNVELEKSVFLLAIA